MSILFFFKCILGLYIILLKIIVNITIKIIILFESYGEIRKYFKYHFNYYLYYDLIKKKTN